MRDRWDDDDDDRPRPSGRGRRDRYDDDFDDDYDRPRRGRRDRYDDDFDEPRRRPRKKKGGGAGPVILVLLLVGVLGFAGCCGGLFWWGGGFGAEWQTFSPPAGGCSVDVPNEANEVPPTVAVTGGGGGGTAYQALLMADDESYEVAYYDLPDGDASKVLDDVVTDLRASLGGTQRSKTTVTVAGCQAREVVLDGAGFGSAEVVVARVVASGGGRVYILMVTGGSVTPTSDNVVKFFNSFKITDPQFKPGAAQQPGWK